MHTVTDAFQSTLWLKQRPPIIFSNYFNKYCSISIIFGKQNLTTLPNVYTCRWNMFTKQSTSLGKFYINYFTLCIRNCSRSPVIL